MLTAKLPCFALLAVFAVCPVCWPLMIWLRIGVCARPSRKRELSEQPLATTRPRFDFRIGLQFQQRDNVVIDFLWFC